MSMSVSARRMNAGETQSWVDPGRSRMIGIMDWLERSGGARRDRTDDLKLAKLALSQLSYGPGQGP